MPDVIAVPHRPFADGHAVRQRVGIRELNLLDDLARVWIVLEEGVQVAVGAPQPAAFPADSVRAVAGRRELMLDHPRLRVDAIDHSRGRHGGPKPSFSPAGYPLDSGDPKM